MIELHETAIDGGKRVKVVDTSVTTTTVTVVTPLDPSTVRIEFHEEESQ